MEMAALNSIHDILCAAVIQIISMTTHMAKAITSHMAYIICIHNGAIAIIHATNPQKWVRSLAIAVAWK